MPASVARTTLVKSGHSSRNVAKIAGEIEPATRQPTTALAPGEAKARHADGRTVGAGDDGGEHRPDQQRRRQIRPAPARR